MMAVAAGYRVSGFVLWHEGDAFRRRSESVSFLRVFCRAGETTSMPGALQEGSGEGWRVRSRTNVSGLLVEQSLLLANMDVSARSILLRDKPQLGYVGHQFSIAPGRAMLHRFLSLSQTLAGNGVSTLHD